MKRILVVSYSQSGQLNEIVNQFLLPFNSSDIDLVHPEPVNPFPFPWTTDIFFDKMPESVLEEPIALKPITFESDKYELIILAYQPWFLSPSLPITSILQDKAFSELMNGTPIVTLIGGRNMWLNAQESIKAYIKKAGGRLVGNIPFMDRTSNLVSAVTILHWMLTGRKDRKWNIFPLPGVSKQDIENGSKFGEIVKSAFEKGQYTKVQNEVLATGLVEIPTDILFIEQRAKKLFRIWARLIKKKGTTPERRKRFVGFFKYYLLIALFMVAPLLLLVYNVLIAPFTQNSIKKKKQYFCGLETN